MRRLTQDQFIEKSHQKHGERYDYFRAKYVKNSSKVIIHCQQHGEFRQRPLDHMRGDGCPSCKFERIAAQKRGNKKSFVQRAQNIHGKAYDYSKVRYVNAITKVEIVCRQHGSFFQTPDKHTSGKTACPRCSHFTSRGEREIEQLLDKQGITYEREKRFDGLVGSTPNSRLKYDFWLPDHNLLIEYDGEHHFKPVRMKGRLTKKQAVDKHQRTKINDRKKNVFARKNGYQLLRIRFDENVEQVLRFFQEGVPFAVIEK